MFPRLGGRHDIGHGVSPARDGARDPSSELAADTAAYHGRLRESRAYTRRAIEAVVNDRDRGAQWAAWYELEGALHEVELGFPDQVSRHATTAIKLSANSDVGRLAAVALAGGLQ